MIFESGLCPRNEIPVVHFVFTVLLFYDLNLKKCFTWTTSDDLLFV